MRKITMSKRIIFLLMCFCLVALVACTPAAQEPAGGSGQDAPAAASGDGSGIVAPEKPYTIGWSTIYLTPTFMQLTNNDMQGRAEYWKAQGVLGELVVADAGGDIATQISQIENMISQDYDAILVTVGSETACNPVLEKAEAAGIPVIGFNSTPNTEGITSKLELVPEAAGEMLANWLVEAIGEKGKIITIGGPAGVAVAERRYNGGVDIIKKYPDIEIVGDVRTEYNEAPAITDFRPVLDANMDVDGVLSFGGAFSSAVLKVMQEKGMDLVPVTGENHNGFMKNWYDEIPNGFQSFATVEPTWPSALALDAAIRAAQGFKLDSFIEIDIPIISQDDLGDYVPNDYPDDYFLSPPLTDADYDKILGPLQK